MKYQTITDVVEDYVEPSLGEFAAEFGEEGLREIAEEAFELRCDIDENGVQHGDSYFALRSDVDFWDIVQAHDNGEE